MAVKWPTNNVVSIFADKTIVLLTVDKDYGRLMSKFLILCGPNSNSNPNPK